MELILLILLLGFSTANDLQLSGCSVSVEVGETAVLPAQVDLTKVSELSQPIIIWKNESNGTVHDYWYNKDNNEYQIEHFKGRTSLFSREEIIKGNVSLKISNITKNDTGIYTCEVHIEGKMIYSVSLCVMEKGENTQDRDPIFPHTPSPKQEHPGLTSGQIVGIVIAVLIVLAALIGVAVFRFYKRNTPNDVI